MFNIRVKHFASETQIQVFSQSHHSKGEFSKAFDVLTGEILPPKDNRKWMFNPFTGEYELMSEMKEKQSIESYARKSVCRTINNIYDIARSDRWHWFVTFTFSPDKVNRYDYSEVSKKLHNWLSNIRKQAFAVKYIVVPEQHKDGAYHFHGLFKDCDGMVFTFSGKRDSKGRRIYNCFDYNLGFSTATRITDARRASSYLCKYITKELCLSTKGKKRYWASRNVERPVVEESNIEMSYEERVFYALNLAGSGAHIKQIETMFGKVTYIDVEKDDLSPISIYSPNPCFPNRLLSF